MRVLRYTALGLFIGLYFLVSFWLWWPYNVMAVSEPIRIINPGKIAVPGEELIYELCYTKTTSMSATVSKNLINDYIITLAPVKGNLPAGQNLKKKISVLVPGYACAGKYRLRWVAHYQVNPLRIIQVEAWSEEFYIQEKKK